MKQNYKNEKGITLVALIITIIVMLILVGVTVNIALKGNLFRTTQGVAQNTQNAGEDETKLSEGKIKKEDGTEMTLEEYANSFAGGLNLSGKTGTKVAYSAGDIDDWRIWRKDKDLGTVTILGQTGINDNLTDLDLSAYVDYTYRNSEYEERIESVYVILLSEIIDLAGIGYNEGRNLTSQEIELLNSLGISLNSSIYDSNLAVTARYNECYAWTIDDTGYVKYVYSSEAYSCDVLVRSSFH